MCYLGCQRDGDLELVVVTAQPTQRRVTLAASLLTSKVRLLPPPSLAKQQSCHSPRMGSELGVLLLSEK